VLADAQVSSAHHELLRRFVCTESMRASKSRPAMATNILFPYDFSPQCDAIVPFVRALAAHEQAQITLLSVVPPALEMMPGGMGTRVGDNPEDWRRALQSRLNEVFVAELADLGVARIADAGGAAARINAFARSHDVDWIMMPTHGLSLFRSVLIGSTAAKVLHDDAKCPVWTAAHVDQQRVGDLPRRILCAVDATAEAMAVLTFAADFSARIGATLQLLHVVDRISDWPTLHSERVLQEQVRETAQATMASIQGQTGISAP
jgi:nucleotide-binding universal stress UspA family protein